MVTWDHVPDGGTPESQWRGWSRDWPALDLAGCARVVVVAPHPDDEVLAAGGLLARLAAAGATVELVAVTDGDASHPGSPTLSPAALAELRRAESVAALAELGLAPATTRLCVPDGRVAAHEDAVAAAVSRVLGTADTTTWVVATWRGDGHPDHESVGRAAHRAAVAAGARLLEVPVWTWHWAHPADPRVPWERAHVVPLDPALMDAKHAAVQQFRTQVEALSADPADAPVLPGFVLERLLRDHETVLA
ncbi:PIG-L family deacetylase [Rhodococcus aerolatus]